MKKERYKAPETYVINCISEGIMGETQAGGPGWNSGISDDDGDTEIGAKKHFAWDFNEGFNDKVNEGFNDNLNNSLH